MKYRGFFLKLIIVLMVCFLFLSACGKSETKSDTVYIISNDLYDYDECIISFDPCGGECDYSSTIVRKGEKYGELPNAQLDGCDFIGWYTDKVDGTRISAESLADENLEDCVLYARYQSRPGTWNDEGGKRKYIGDDGKSVKNSFRYIDNYWYCFDDSGVAITGWFEKNDKKYYFEQDGKMATGFRRFDGEWIYFKEYPLGYMARNEWVQVGSDWYFFDEDGSRLKGWICFEGKWYYLNEVGALQHGWLKVNGNTYYLDDTSGRMYLGWSKIKGKIYYFDNSGILVRDEYIGDKYINSQGIFEPNK